MIKIHEINSIAKLALPLMAAFFAQKCMQLIDTVMMGWIGPHALAAGALGTSIYITILVFCMGTLSAVGVFIVRAKGANDSDDVKSSMQHGLVLALLLSLPGMLLIWFAPHFLSLIGEDHRVVEGAALLLHGLAWGFPGYLLFLVFREFIAAFSLTRIVMAVTLISIPLTFTANYLLIYGKYGLPQLGIAGIGYANAGVMWFMFLCLLTYSKQNVMLKKYISFELFKLDYSKITSMLYIGAPSGTLFILESSMFLSAVIMMGYFGVINLAAYQVAMQCASLAYSIPFALSMTTALLVGHAAGAKNLMQLKRSAFLCAGFALIFSAMIAGVFILAPEFLIKLFLKPGEANYKDIAKIATSFLAIAALFQCFDALQGVANGALRGMRDTFIPMIISIGCYWLLGVCSAYYFSFHTYLGAEGIWYGLTLGLFSSGILLMLRFLKKLKYEKAH